MSYQSLSVSRRLTIPPSPTRVVVPDVFWDMWRTAHIEACSTSGLSRACHLCGEPLNAGQAAHLCAHGEPCRYHVAIKSEGEALVATVCWDVADCTVCDDDDTGLTGWRGTVAARRGS